MIDVVPGAGAFIGGVDPLNPDVVFVRVKVMENTIGRVVMTRDAGATWTQVWRGQGDVAGFALSGDGMTLAVGGPDSGLNVASTSDFVFSKPNPLGPSCLTWAGGRLFACAKEAIDFFSIGVSDDKGVNFTPVLHFPDIMPRACSAGSSAAVCGTVWSSVAAAIGIDAGVPDASVEPIPPTTPAPKVDASGGWSCAVTRVRPGGSWAPASLFGVMLVARRARRTSRRRRARRSDRSLR
jgi:hypothetical protein